MKNGIENGYYHEITPAGFGIAIKAGKVLFSKQSDFQKVEVFETDSELGRVLTLDDLSRNDFTYSYDASQKP